MKRPFFFFVLLWCTLIFSIPILDEEQYNTVLSLDQPVVVTFTASWCPLCTDIARPLAKIALESQFNPVLFVEVDTDLLPSIAAYENVPGVPAFIFRTKGQEIKREVGIKKVLQFGTFFKDELIKLLAADKQLTSINSCYQPITDPLSWSYATRTKVHDEKTIFDTFYDYLYASVTHIFIEPDTVRWIQL